MVWLLINTQHAATQHVAVFFSTYDLGFKSLQPTVMTHSQAKKSMSKVSRFKI